MSDEEDEAFDNSAWRETLICPNDHSWETWVWECDDLPSDPTCPVDECGEFGERVQPL